jgi:hypothetical protein
VIIPALVSEDQNHFAIDAAWHACLQSIAVLLEGNRINGIFQKV